jgi:cytochrome c oxidase subunit 1
LRIKKQPYQLFILAAIILFIAGLFSFNAALDIHMHGTYYVFSLTYFIWAFAFILFIFWLLYLATKNILFSKSLSWTHIILTIIGCVFILTIPFFTTNSYEGLAGMPRRYFDIGQSKTYKINSNLTKTEVILVFLLVAGQVTFLLNFVIGFYMRFNRKNRS